MTYIYLVENCYGDPNKVYIGKTIKSRKNDHKKTYGNQIIYTIIDQIPSLNRKDWEPIETMWIHTFINWGLEVVNKRKKGGSGPEYLSQEIKDKKSQSMKGKLLGTKRPGTGSKHKRTQETKNKISKKLKGISKPKGFITKEHKVKLKEIHSIPIYQYDKNGDLIKKWNSTQEAVLYYNIQKGHICNALKGRSKTCLGFIWKYV